MSRTDIRAVYVKGFTYGILHLEPIHDPPRIGLLTDHDVTVLQIHFHFQELFFRNCYLEMLLQVINKLLKLLLVLCHGHSIIDVDSKYQLSTVVPKEHARIILRFHQSKLLDDLHKLLMPASNHTDSS